jgi:hypothetical protein
MHINGKTIHVETTAGMGGGGINENGGGGELDILQELL